MNNHFFYNFLLFKHSRSVIIVIVTAHDFCYYFYWYETHQHWPPFYILDNSSVSPANLLYNHND